MGSKKGNPFEREISLKLSRWWSNGIEGKERDDIFYRTSGSGSRATSRGKKGLATTNSYGDIMANDPIGGPLTSTCIFEIKRGYSGKGGIDPLDFIDKKRGMPILLEWWNKLEQAAHKFGIDHTALVFRRDRKETCIMTTNLFIGIIESEYDSFLNVKYLVIGKGTGIRIKLIIILLDDFLKFADPKKIISLYEQKVK